MTNYNLGDIALIGFPHTDLQHTSKRPALVLYDSGDQDILVARVTTQQYLTKTDYKILNWEKSGLLTESYIRLGKPATIQIAINNPAGQAGDTASSFVRTPVLYSTPRMRKPCTTRND